MSWIWIEDPGVEIFQDLNLTELNVDEAYVILKSELNTPAWLYALSDECYKCPFSLIAYFEPNGSTIKTSARHGTTWRVCSENIHDTIATYDNSSMLCQVSANVGEFGVYDLLVRSAQDIIFCELVTVKPPVNVYYAILICFLGLFLATGLFYFVLVAVRRWQHYRRQNSSFPSSLQLTTSSDRREPTPAQPPPRQRLHSLDTFRGISIVLMIFVNYGAGQYWFFEHATWNGLQVADLLFPWFMWIMGVCIPISIKSQLKRNVSRQKIVFGVTRRGCMLFMLGLCLNTLYDSNLQTIRLFGVLQRFALTYTAMAVLLLVLTPSSSDSPRIKFLETVQDVTSITRLWLVMLLIVTLHTVLVFCLHVPGCTTGYLGPAGLHDNSTHERHCIGGATGYVDRLVLGETHIYQHPTARYVYGSGPFDPEGVLGCLTSLFQVFLGVQAGNILGYHRDWKSRVSRWMFWGTLSGTVGAVLCQAGQEDGWIPVNKNLWSLSFVLVTSCFAFYMLSALYYVIDVKNWWIGSPFKYPGMNATIMYVGHSVTSSMFPWHWALGPMNTHFVLLAESLWGTALWMLIAFWLYHIKFFLAL